ncbi:hypothetical protein O9Z70_04410 [Devosia sp. YIM 151766]|uniref:hypothetical protein n=1 Tax=Devosia sp. YIM 151766 TaxID=3017325 RepID=UPI00255C4C95|nr:hypothetical protein [Devosia sp. YIM 151766]WIY53792.1 hypothetical protein O9Z70_04410 [Devosia sp. YIM 151766]
MALDNRILKMVAETKGANNSPATPGALASVVNDLADLGLAKAAKSDLRRIVVRAINREREAEFYREARGAMEELDRLP